jgi:glycosyltransferase involved in cell wall biosynthesis
VIQFRIPGRAALPAVSVVIPTYKHRDFILDTVNSVLSQTFRDFEIIVVNDGSPDDTASLLRPMAESGMIRYVEQSNAAAAAARNRGLEMARGKFIAFLDDDDLWPQDKLEWQVLALSNSPDYP